MLKRIFDFTVALFLSVLLSGLLLLVALFIKLTSKGPILYWSNRVGKNNILFSMPKFRTMLINTPVVATHLLDNPKNYLTPIGSFLRKTSLDELPQLWSILKGEMSFVGPRPALYNQTDLIEERTQLHIQQLLPGLTGLAQVSGRDELPIPLKVKLDHDYLIKKSFLFDLKIIFITILKTIKREGVTH